MAIGNWGGRCKGSPSFGSPPRALSPLFSSLLLSPRLLVSPLFLALLTITTTTTGRNLLYLPLLLSFLRAPPRITRPIANSLLLFKADFTFFSFEAAPALLCRAIALDTPLPSSSTVPPPHTHTHTMPPKQARATADDGHGHGHGANGATSSSASGAGGANGHAASSTTASGNNSHTTTNGSKARRAAAASNASASAATAASVAAAHQQTLLQQAVPAVVHPTVSLLCPRFARLSFLVLAALASPLS